MLNNETRTVEEQYSTACNTSDLRVPLDHTRRVPADVVIAAGMSKGRLGSALLRLHSEWDSSPKPQPATKEQIEVIARSYKKPDIAKAQKQADEWFHSQCVELMCRLKSLPMVRDEMIQIAKKEGMESAESFAPRVVAWWLDQRCHVCKGVQEEVVVGTGRLSGRACHGCEGSGRSKVPGGSAGRRLANIMDDCVQRGREQIRNRLRDMR